MTTLLSLQQYLPKLSQRTVAYINVDIAVFGETFSSLLLTARMKED